MLRTSSGEELAGGQVATWIRSEKSRRATILALIVGSQYVIILDASIVNVALPSIQRSFHLSGAELQDVVTAYAVAFGGPLILGGRLADIIGRRTMFRFALVAFGVTSLLCGFASSGGALVASRAAQGLSAALLAPSTLGLLTSTYSEGKERNHALSRFGAATVLGSLSGLIVGGILVTAAGWRSVFFVNGPITVAMMIAAGKVLGPDREEGSRPNPLRASLRELDFAGAILATGGLSVIVLALNFGSLHGWASTEFASLLALGLGLIALFVVVELRARHPLLRIGLLRIATVRCGNLLIFVFGILAGAGSLTTGLYLQTVLHFSPLQAGFALVPQGIIGYLISRLATRAFGIFGLRRSVTVSYAIAALALAALSQLMTVHQEYLVLLPCMVVLGGSQIISTIGSTIATSYGVPRPELGVAGAMRQTSFQVGLALGVATFASIAATRTQGLLVHGVRHVVALQAGYQLVVEGLAIVSLCGSMTALVGLRRHVRREPTGT